MLTAVEMSETARKRSYLRQGCQKGTTKAINRAFTRTRLLVTPTPIIMRAPRRNAHARAHKSYMHLPLSIEMERRSSVLFH